jgi:hypothetical protein
MIYICILIDMFFLLANFFSFLRFNLAFFCLIFTSDKLYKFLIFN